MPQETDVDQPVRWIYHWIGKILITASVGAIALVALGFIPLGWIPFAGVLAGALFINMGKAPRPPNN